MYDFSALWKLHRQSVRQTLHEAANNNEAAFLKKPIYFEEIFTYLTSEESEKCRTLDIPIKDIVSVRSRSDMFELGNNWNQAALNLKCEDKYGEPWGATWPLKKEVHRYFTTPFFGKPAPSEAMPGCGSWIRFSITGGAVWGSNCQHRIVAGMVLKAKYEGLDAKFLQVPVSYSPIDPTAEPIITRCLAENSQLFFYSHRSEANHLLLIEIKADQSWIIHKRKDKGMPFIKLYSGRKQWLLTLLLKLFTEAKSLFHCHDIPVDLMERLIDKRWEKRFINAKNCTEFNVHSTQ
ncbi:hypothetical protein QNZ87_004277 [Vibrio parahaemolyticus]|nr:hypothetical protein [Vibrio parahaemolyticus]